MLYFCEYCNFNSKLKGDYSRHLKTKKHMSNTTNNSVNSNEVSQSITKVSQEGKIGINKYHKSITRGITEVSQSITNQNNEHFCNVCNKKFTKKNNLYRHKKHFCNNNINDLPFFKDKQELVEYVKKELMEEFSTLQSDDNQIINIENKENSNSNSNNNSNNNNNSNSNNINSNNTLNNNNISNNNNINNNITINAFGHEDLTFLKEEDILNVLSQMRNGIPELVRIVHKQENNRNFFIKNFNNNLAVYLNENNELKHIDLEYIISSLINSNIVRYTDYFIEYKDKMSDEMNKKIEQIIDTNMNEDNQYLYKVKVKNTILDYSDANKKALKKIKSK
jgi:hypothetical protein